jgi:scyllo-inositol 2-dehydrogenase (NADP+)
MPEKTCVNGFFREPEFRALYLPAMLRIAVLGVLAASALFAQDQPFRLAIAGLVHGHVQGFLTAAKKRSDVQIVGIADPDPVLRKKYAKGFSLPPSVLFANTRDMLKRTKPEALAIFTSTYDHPAAVEAAAGQHIPAMMEKPLAVSLEHARRIQAAGIPIVVNYETTWYRSHGEIWRIFKESKAAGEIRRMVAEDGHEGPKEIHVQPEFFGWLTDPEKNGAGALFDFGCYGANLMTWLMDNQRPVAVTALAHTNKPAIYPRVDDEATILLQYPGAQGVIEASWNWPFNRKDLEVYGQTGYAIATGGNNLRVGDHPVDLLELPPDQRDSISYLKAVARGKLKPAGLSSLENNLVVTEILDAARTSAKTGRTIHLK